MPPLPIRTIAVGLVALGSGLGVTALAAGGVGFVNMERVFAQSPQGRVVQERLAEEFGAEQREFATREQEIRQMQARLERDKPLMSKAQLEKKENEIKALIEQFEKDFAAVQEQVAKIQQEEGEKLMEPAQEAIAAVAKEKDISAVFEINAFDPNRAGMIYFEEGADVDLTDAVIEALNKD
jgi:outer membrane protein